jgi:WD40 repeat protein
MQVACGTSTGGIGVLDLSTWNFRNVLRSHTDEVLQMHLHAYANQILTLSKDLTIRLFDFEKNYDQTYEFTFSQDDNCVCLSPHPTALQFVAGFSSGVFRVFDIEKTCILEEVKCHSVSIMDL